MMSTRPVSDIPDDGEPSWVAARREHEDAERDDFVAMNRDRIAGSATPRIKANRNAIVPPPAHPNLYLIPSASAIRGSVSSPLSLPDGHHPVLGVDASVQAPTATDALGTELSGCGHSKTDVCKGCA